MTPCRKEESLKIKNEKTIIYMVFDVLHQAAQLADRNKKQA